MIAEEREVTVAEALASIRSCRLEMARNRARRAREVLELRRQAQKVLTPRPRVLLAEDNTLVGSSVKRLLERAGYDVQLVETVAAARAALCEGEWAVVVSDGIGEKTDPFVIAREARRVGVPRVVLWTGGLASAELEPARVEAGADFALGKGGGGHELVQLLQRAGGY